MMIQAILKELRLLFRDIHGIAMLFVMPTVFILIMSFALSEADESYKDAKVALVSASENTLNDRFYQKMAEDYHTITRFTPDQLVSLQALLSQKSFDLIIINPNERYDLDFTKDQPLEIQTIASTDKTLILGVMGSVQKIYTQLRLDHYFEQLPKPELPVINKKASKAIQKKQAQARTKVLKSQPDLEAINNYLTSDQIHEVYLDIHNRTVVKPDSVQQSVPAWLIFGMFFIMIPLSNVMAEERITNTLVRLRLAKASPLRLLISKFIPYFLVNQIQLVCMTLLGTFLLPYLGIKGLTLVGPWYNYYFIAVAISFCALGYGLFVSVIAKSTEHAVVLGGGGNILMAAIGGIMVPSYVMPEAMQTLAKCSPMSWGLKGFHDLLLNGYSLTQVLDTWYVLMAFAGIFLLLTYCIYRHQLKRVA